MSLATKIIDRLAADLREAFPGMQGVSPRNLHLMRSFAEAYPDIEIVKQVVSQLPGGTWSDFCKGRRILKSASGMPVKRSPKAFNAKGN